MARTHVQTREFLASRLDFLITTPEVLRLVHDITTCTVEWLDHPDLEALEASGGRELFPCFTTYLQRHLMEVRGVIYPNLTENEHVIYHVIRLDLADFQFFFRLRTTQTAFLLSPFHCRFLSMLFGRLVIQHLSLAAREQEGLYPFTPYSLEEQVVADYLQSLTQAPCATIKLDAQDNPYIGSMLYTAADLRRCGMLDKGREEAIIRAWRLFKRLLYYSVEGERLFTGFAILTNYRPLSYYRQRWPSLLWFHEANYTSLDQGLQGLRQFLLNADGRSTFLAMLQQPDRGPAQACPGHSAAAHHHRRLAHRAAPGHHLPPGPGQLLGGLEGPQKPPHPPLPPGIPPGPPPYSPVPGHLLAGAGAPVEGGLPRCRSKGPGPCPASSPCWRWCAAAATAPSFSWG